MMMTPKITALALFGMLLVSCAPPKPTMVLRDNVLPPNGKPTAPSVTSTQADAVAVSNSPKPKAPAVQSAPGGDALRMPDMYGLPGDGDFRTTQPKNTESGSGAVIARPPKE
jgi:hypothetical protein